MKWNFLAIFLAITLQALLAYGAGDGIVQVIRSDDQEVILELAVAGFRVQQIDHEGSSYHRMTIPNFGLTTFVGRPQLPVRGELIGIPRGARPVLEVLAADYKTLSGYQIAPVPRPRMDEESAGFGQSAKQGLRFNFIQDESVYVQDAFYPSEPVATGFTGRMRDQAVMQVLFHPIRFNPVRKEIRFYNRILVRIGFIHAEEDGIQGIFGLNKLQVPAQPGPVEDTPYERMLKGLLLNDPGLGR
jgi:hypothetical protein